MYHWNALNWLFKLFAFGFTVAIRLPKNGCWFVAGCTFPDCIFGCGCVCVGLNIAPKLLFKLLLKLLFTALLLICTGGGDIIGGTGDCCCLTGLCNFNWFIDIDWFDDFDFVDIKLSKSIFMAVFDHVWPTSASVVAFNCAISSNWAVDCGVNILLVGCKILPTKMQKYTQLINHNFEHFHE